MWKLKGDSQSVLVVGGDFGHLLQHDLDVLFLTRLDLEEEVKANVNVVKQL